MFCNLLVSECMKVQLQRIKVVCNQRVSFCRRVLLKRRRSDHHLYTSCCSWRVATCCVLMLQLDTVVCPSQCTPQCPKEAWCTCPASDSSASHCSMRHAITSHYSCELFGFYRTSTSTPATATRSQRWDNIYNYTANSTKRGKPRPHFFIDIRQMAPLVLRGCYGPVIRGPIFKTSYGDLRKILETS